MRRGAPTPCPLPPPPPLEEGGRRRKPALRLGLLAEWREIGQGTGDETRHVPSASPFSSASLRETLLGCAKAPPSRIKPTRPSPGRAGVGCFAPLALAADQAALRTVRRASATTSSPKTSAAMTKAAEKAATSAGPFSAGSRNG